MVRFFRTKHSEVILAFGRAESPVHYFGGVLFREVARCLINITKISAILYLAAPLSHRLREGLEPEILQLT